MNALISPNEKIVDPNTGVVVGERIAEVSAGQFEVASPLFWVDCDADIMADWWYYDPNDQQIKPTPQPIPPEPPEQQPTVTGAQTL
jgi:hypothetical protein